MAQKTIFNQYLVINHHGKEYEKKKYIYIHIYIYIYMNRIVIKQKLN